MALNTINGFGMFDCHAHLSDNSFNDDIDVLLDDAHSKKVTDIIVVSEGINDAQKVIDLCKMKGRLTNKPRLHASIGMHPCEADLDILPKIIELIDAHHDDLVCIGEIGLDYAPHIIGKDSKSEVTAKLKEIQREVFVKHAERANLYDLPLNVHSRSAGHHTLKLMGEIGVKKALMHSFDGKPKYALSGYTDFGFYFSVAPSICRNPGLQNMVKMLPLSALVLETDCPVLGPVKNERAVPAGIVTSCEWISKIKEISTEEVMKVTSQNARNLFPKAFK
mmetsp:Transcript_20436/g.30235  ORF Transcript_20436/g.30235 Transcript_20436/m.30235 type:complete len:278 (+) Transcript_20436:181-1014(+)